MCCRQAGYGGRDGVGRRGDIRRSPHDALCSLSLFKKKEDDESIIPVLEAADAAGPLAPLFSSRCAESHPEKSAAFLLSLRDGREMEEKEEKTLFFKYIYLQMEDQREEMKLPASLAHFSSSWFARVEWEIDAGGSLRFSSSPWIIGRVCSLFFNIHVDIERFLPDAELP